jgi:diadenosine tetraphosphate (Ap4A) HIT family hydrolase
MSRPVYDSSNVFAKILRGEIPCNKVFENDHALAFADIRPLAPVHILIIPKGAYVDLADFSIHASSDEKAGFFDAVANVTRTSQGALQAQGFRAISNSGINGGQEVPHFHMHILGGRRLGPMLSSSGDS